MKKILFLDTQDGPSCELLGLRHHLCQYDHHSDFVQLLSDLRQPRQHAVTVFYLPPLDGRTWNDQQFFMNVTTLAKLADAVVLITSETVVFSSILDKLVMLHNVIVMTPGQHNYGPGCRAFVCWQHWIQDLAQTWQTENIQNRLVEAGQIATREYCFEAMLGGERPYRTWLHDWIRRDPVMAGSTLMSYYGAAEPEEYMLEPGTEIDKWPEPMHTGHAVRYHGALMRLACVPPVSVYQRSWFTVLAETTAHSAWNFYTEKIAKPLLAGRVFLVLGGQHYLRGLRESGFQTFHGVIDESYDLESDNRLRAQMVFEEMRRIQQRDPAQIMEDTRAQREHNQALAQSRDWMTDAMSHATQIAEHVAGRRLA